MHELVCIVCPKGCTMCIEQTEDGEYKVSGNTCKRGAQFAISERIEPKRTICTTVRTVFSQAPVLPVRVSAEIPKDKIFEVMREINSVILQEPVSRGEVVLKNVLNLGVDIIATSDLLRQMEN